MKASAVEPAKPPMTSPLARRRTLRALSLTMVWPEADLAVAADDDAAALADHEDRRRVHAGGGVFGHVGKDSGGREGSGR